jgi:hypothetical protein
MASLELFKATQYSAAVTINIAAATGNTTSATYAALSGCSRIIGYSIVSGANPGTLRLAIASAAGVSTLTATTSANVAAANLVLQVHFYNEVGGGLLVG